MEENKNINLENNKLDVDILNDDELENVSGGRDPYIIYDENYTPGHVLHIS